MTLAGLVFASMVAADPVITRDFGAVRVEEIVGALAEQTGVKMTTSTNLVNDILFMSLKETPLSEVQDILARQTGGKWVDRNGFLVLEAPIARGSLEDLMAARSIDSWFEQYKEPEAISKDGVVEAVRALTQAEKGNPGAYPQKQIEALSRLNPTNRAIGRIVKAIGKDFLMSLPDGGRAVFSTRPTSMQRAFPAAAARAVEQFRSEYIAYAQLINSAGLGGEPTRYYVAGLQGIERGPALISDFEVIISRPEYGVTAELRVPDPKGEYYVLSDQIVLNPSFASAEDISKERAERIKTLPMGKDTAEVVMDPVPAEVAEVSAALNFGGRAPRKALSPTTRKMMLDMDKRELFGKLAEPYLRALAKRSGKTFVTPVSDFLFMEMVNPEMRGEQAKKITYSQLATALGASMMGQMLGNLEWTQTDKAIEFRASDPRAARGQRIDRRIVARYLRAIEAKTDRLDADADLAVSEPGQVTFQFAMIFASAMTMQNVNLISSNLPVLKLYGSLSQSERLRAKAEGITIGINALGPPLNGRVRELIFGHNPSLQPEGQTEQSAEAPEGLAAPPAAASNAPDELDWDDSQYRWGGGVSSPKMEVTRAMAQGVPLGSTVFIQVEARPRLFGFSKDLGGDRFTMPITASSLGWSMAWREKNPNQAIYGFAESFRVGRSRVLKVAFKFPGTGTMTRGTVLDEVDLTTKELKFADLPESFRNRANAALEEARKHGGFDPGSTGVKPP